MSGNSKTTIVVAPARASSSALTQPTGPALPPALPLAASPGAPPPGGPRKPRRLLCLKEVCHRVGLARATVYRQLEPARQAGPRPFPLPVQVTVGRIGWHEHEIDAWIESLPRAGLDDVIAGLKGKDADEI